MYKLKEQVIENDEFYNDFLTEMIDYYVMGLDKDRYKVRGSFCPYSHLSETISQMSKIEGVHTIRLYKNTYKFSHEINCSPENQLRIEPVAETPNKV